MALMAHKADLGRTAMGQWHVEVFGAMAINVV